MFHSQKPVYSKTTGFPRSMLSGFSAAFLFSFLKGFESAAESVFSWEIFATLEVWVLCNTHTLSPTGDISPKTTPRTLSHGETF